MLRELEFKKPQLDELVHTAESLKTDLNRQQLQGKGMQNIYFFFYYKFSFNYTVIFTNIPPLIYIKQFSFYI